MGKLQELLILIFSDGFSEKVGGQNSKSTKGKVNYGLTGDGEQDEGLGSMASRGTGILSPGSQLPSFHLRIYPPTLLTGPPFRHC